MKIENGIRSETINISDNKIIKKEFDAYEYERIKLDYETVKQRIYDCKSQVEMAKKLGCSCEKLRTYLRKTDLYELFCKVHKVKYFPPVNLVCSVCGVTENVRNLRGVPYCKRHYNQMYRYGNILETTIYDKNEIIIEDNIAKIIMRNKDQTINGMAAIDAEDCDKIKSYKWYIEGGGYCVTKGINKVWGIKIANVIYNDFINKYDHINHDRLDNRKENLRVVTSQQNSMNMGKKCTNTSGGCWSSETKQNKPALDCYINL